MAGTWFALSKSEIVREAIRKLYDRIGRLSERERRTMLRTFDETIPNIPARPAAEVDAEIAEIRTARCSGGRATRRPQV
jgi:Arc/MetJ-type ribon-helix-helix transcriptional regulator